MSVGEGRKEGRKRKGICTGSAAIRRKMQTKANVVRLGDHAPCMADGWSRQKRPSAAFCSKRRGYGFHDSGKGWRKGCCTIGDKETDCVHVLCTFVSPSRYAGCRDQSCGILRSLYCNPGSRDEQNSAVCTGLLPSPICSQEADMRLSGGGGQTGGAGMWIRLASPCVQHSLCLWIFRHPASNADQARAVNNALAVMNNSLVTHLGVFAGAAALT